VPAAGRPLAFFGEDGGELDQLLVVMNGGRTSVGQARRAPHGDLGLTGGPDGCPAAGWARRSQEVVDDEVRTLVAAPAPTTWPGSPRVTPRIVRPILRFTPNALNS